MSTPPIEPYPSYVYFARCGQYVKIGKSVYPEQRIKTLFASKKLIRPDDLDETQRVELLHTIPDCRVRDERIIHSLFARHHVAGEWYRFDLPFIHQLSGLRYQTDRERRRHAFLVRHALKRARLRVQKAVA